jgi:hypothetical protein
VEAREVVQAEQAVWDRRLRHLERAIHLAPTIEICEALLRGEAVPASKLDPDAVQRYDLRR